MLGTPLGMLGIPLVRAFAQGVSSRGVKAQPRGKPSGLPFDANFVDIAAQAGLRTPLLYGGQEKKTYIVETVGCGCAFFDYDNDGWLDLIVAGPHGASLFHNDGTGRFADRSELLPPALLRDSIGPLLVADIDGDGDQDIILGDRSGVHVLRNDGGNAHLAMRVQLTALGLGSGKNNSFGIGSRLEVRAGELYQTRVVTGPVTPFGLGSHFKADVLRVQWTNGVPQTIYFPGTDQDVLELQQLKGSCAFLYTWNGKKFEFVTDVMWRSALGMPVGIMGKGDGGRGMGYAPAGASQEYIRIPGEALQPRNGRYVLQVTEELWETAYLDQLRLVAVDHPDSVDVFVDERFPPAPGPARLRLFQVVHRRPPRSAVDGRGSDVLDDLREHDDRYVSNLTPLRYQGLTEPHELILDLDAEAGRPGTFLFLRGWIYPSDASINVALSQQHTLRAEPPVLEARDAQGRWVSRGSIGFPSGKDKTVVIDLAGIFPTGDHHVRLKTNLQVYWDEVFVADNAEAAATSNPARCAFAPNTCLPGFVWREADDWDWVCVNSQVRANTRTDNALAASRRSPSGGPFGPDTCLQGFVWREAFPGDHACVTAATRTQARDDNEQAGARLAAP